jgi:hypothetical protein
VAFALVAGARGATASSSAAVAADKAAPESAWNCADADPVKSNLTMKRTALCFVPNLQAAMVSSAAIADIPGKHPYDLMRSVARGRLGG